MKRFIPFLALVAVVAMVGCSGDSPSAKPVPTVVPSAWGITSLNVSDSSPFVGSPILVEVEVTKDGSPVPDGTVVELASSGPGAFFGFFSGVLTKSDLVLNEDVSVLTEDGVATVFFVVVPADDNENPSGNYLIQARLNDVLSQVTVSYVDRPATDTFQLLSVNPDRGPYTGGQVVTLFGVNISAPVEVFFIVNGRPYEASVIDVIEGIDGWIQVATPPFSGQDWSIEQEADVRAIVGVGTGNEQTDTLFDVYTLLPQSQTAGPVIFGVSPSSGRSSGGEVVNILGQGFTFPAANTVVEFIDSGGASRVASILAVAPDGTQIQVETPRFSTLPLEDDDPQDVVVTTPNGNGTLVDGFIVLADEPQPTINSISPTSGPLDGGTLVTIFGNGFQVPMQVWFGDLTALDVNVFNDTTPADNDRITCVTPNYSQQGDVPPVTVNVTVTNMTSGKEDTLGAAFTFGDVLFISGNTPSEGGLGDLVIIFGSGFEDPLQVFLGNEQMEVVSVSGTELVVRIPDDLGTLCSATSGEFTVVLLETNQETTGGSFTIRGNTPLVLSVDPVIYQDDGFGNIVPDDFTVNGLHFADDVLVGVGSFVVASGNVTVVSDTTIDVVNLPSLANMGIVFSTAPCTLPGGEPGQQESSTPVSVSVTNLPGSCIDTLVGAIVVEPASVVCIATPAVLETSLPGGTWQFPATANPGCSADFFITIQNTQGADATLISFNAPAANFFFVSTTCAGTLSYLEECTYTMRFCPSLPAGDKQDQLIIDYFDSVNPQVIFIDLIGTGS